MKQLLLQAIYIEDGYYDLHVNKHTKGSCQNLTTIMEDLSIRTLLHDISVSRDLIMATD